MKIFPKTNSTKNVTNTLSPWVSKKNETTDKPPLFDVPFRTLIKRSLEDVQMQLSVNTLDDERVYYASLQLQRFSQEAYGDWKRTFVDPFKDRSISFYRKFVPDFFKNLNLYPDCVPGT